MIVSPFKRKHKKKTQDILCSNKILLISPSKLAFIQHFERVDHEDCPIFPAHYPSGTSEERWRKFYLSMKHNWKTTIFNITQSWYETICTTGILSQRQWDSKAHQPFGTAIWKYTLKVTKIPMSFDWLHFWAPLLATLHTDTNCSII